MTKAQIFQYKTCAFLFVLSLSVVLSGCVTTTTHISPAVTESMSAYPKASADADTLINLESNKQRTTFYIDGKKIAVGKRVKALINKGSHTVIAEPEGYFSKEEFIQPPYMPNSRLSFTFLLGDQITNKNQSTPGTITGKKTSVEKKKPQINMNSPYVYNGKGILKTNDPHQIISGKVLPAEEIKQLTVNGENANFSENGDFSISVYIPSRSILVKINAETYSGEKVTLDFMLEKKTETATVPNPSGGLSVYKTGNHYALIIGINKYQYLNKLETAVTDAKDVDYILKSLYGYKTKLILDASRNEILQALNEMRNQLNRDDSFLIYYAGHGIYEEKAEKAYWLPVNAREEDPTNWIIVDTITSDIKRIEANHIIVVSDSCYSGTLTRAVIPRLKVKGERNRYLNKLNQKKSRTLIASGGNEPVIDKAKKGDVHSVFASAFLKGLRDMQQNVFTAEELFHDFIKESVSGRAEQVPEYSVIRNSGHDGGEYLFFK